jgi:uncharacterized membrane protein
MKYVLCSVLLIYFFFASGIAYEIATPMLTNKIEAPYSIGLSAERTGIMPVATESDIKAIQWLKDNAQGRKIVTDYNGYLLVHGFVQNHVDNLRYGDLTHIQEGDLIFLSSWNIKNQKMVEGAGGVGIREVYKLPEFMDCKQIYSSDGSKMRIHYDSALILEKQ